jgi:DNA-directed RNA polymerase specialized sigma24 family protein
MTMNAKRFLSRAYHIDQKIERRTEEAARLRSRLEKATAQLTGMPRGGNSDWTDTEVKVLELEEQIKAEIERLCQVKREIREAIDQVEDKRYRELLEMRYLSGFTFEQIAVAMHYDWRHVMRLHGEALAAVQHVIECHI